MPHEAASLPASSMIALASEVLSSNGYRVVRDLSDLAQSSDCGLLAEDSFSVVSVIAYETWQQLEAGWLNAQADLVELLARRLARSAAKAWDGYLVLLCAGEPLNRRDVVEIERDTTRVRKIVATGSRLLTSADITRVLSMLLPLNLPQQLSALEDVLDTLPNLIDPSIDTAAVRTVIDAFRSMEPPLERLHQLGREP